MSSEFGFLVRAASSFTGWTDGQGVEQFRGRCLIVSIIGHPVQDPGVDIFRITSDVQCRIELKNELFIPINNVSAEVEQSRVMKNMRTGVKQGSDSMST